MNASAVRETQPGAVLPEAPSVTALYTKDPAQNKADAFLPSTCIHRRSSRIRIISPHPATT
jgi:hypothetical protein